MALTNKDKKELALSLFLNTDKSQKEIAARLEVSENTLSTWANAGGWATIKGANTATRPQIIADLYQQISLIKDKAVDDEGKRRVMNTHETQAIRMISKSISELDKRLSIDTYITVIEEMMTWLFEVAPALAKSIMPKVDGFVDSKFKELS
ncbi:hypothetical protein GCM10023185_15450 [Hymenobacter saemangeumensis]|uniref:DDE transposase family protein n=1 Tax=Hymenobacter saemangeumensis TaxID=1084522 RepID=A0ABP8I997_9BACT